MVSPSEDQYKRGKPGSPDWRGQGEVKQGRISQHFYVNVRRDPDRDGEYISLTRSHVIVIDLYSCTLLTSSRGEKIGIDKKCMRL